MKVLNKIKSDHIIAIDLESVRIADKYESLDEQTKQAWQYKHKSEGEVPSELELSEKWEKSASLYAEFSKVCAVSIVVLHKDKLFCKEFYGDNEKEILESLGTNLDNLFAKKSEPRLLGHSSKFFDYPFLAKRYIVNELQIPDSLDVTLLKPWENTLLDTNDLWKLGGTGYGASLLALCNVLKVPTSKVDLVGDEVGTAYYNSEFERIGRYCSLDTVATFNIFRRFKQESIFSFDDVEYINGIEVKEKPVETNPLEDIYNSDYLSDKVKDALKTKLGKKKLTKKDLEFIQDLLEQIYIRSEFMDTDKPEVIEGKKSEIQAFIKTLNK